MRKVLCLALCLCLPLAAGTAAADRTVVTALAADVNPDTLVSVAVDARIPEYDPASGLLTVELIVPEMYDPEDIQSLKPGDAIFTQGREVEIRTVSDDSGYIVLNAEDDEAGEAVWLYESIDMNYWIMEYDDHTWTSLGTVQVPVPEHLLFLDGIDPSSGEALNSPSVHSGKEFLGILAAEDTEDSGFTANNVMVVFDGNGELALIQRNYVPWQ